MITKESAFQKISELVERFEEQYTSYMKSEYNETLTRRDFIDPFFKALGWDMDNEQGYAEAYREVIHEDRLKIGTASKAPDYSFRLSGGKRLFFVEAKKPGVSVKDEIQPAYQIRRYGWSAKLAISIITDFEEFSIYDCTVKPNPADKASVARIGYFTFRDYLGQFDFIWDTFSKERVLKGSFDRYAHSDTQKKGTATVDKEFLQSLDRWRTYLATSISWNNKGLDEDEINFAVQQTIDRIIFLRIAEDRSVEPYGNLKHALGQGEYYQNLFEQFHKADEKYNSGLFDFTKDRICAGLKIENKVIKTIVNELYYPECPYEFSVLSVEILGSAYEQFLGKVIRITPAHHAKIEEKPEVRKAGGVYYTPQYIVEYIVKNTVGKLVEGKSPAEVSALKIVDPACGSGSFLIGAYQYLMDWHVWQYTSSPLAKGKGEEGKRGSGEERKLGRGDKMLTPEGNLTTAEKKRILLNNIYGVDIDVNAVEVTKLSLLLKCLEGETEASIQQQFSLWNERVLPTLDNNIKSGNSLIDTDFYGAELDFGLEKKIKPFNWKNAFPDVFKQGGFDAVIGNPPYGATLSLKEDSYLRSKYQVANYQLDSYILFIERGKYLMRIGGFLGHIIPTAWVASTFDIKMRKFIIEEFRIESIVITPKQTFKDATVETCIIILSNNIPVGSFFVDRWDIHETKKYSINLSDIQSDRANVFPIYADNEISSIIQKIRKQDKELNDFAEVSWGIKAYQKGKGMPKQKGFESKDKIYHAIQKTKATHLPLLGGSEISRYFLKWKGNFIDYGKWLAEPRQPKWFSGERVLVREITANGIIQATYIKDDFVFSNSVDGIAMKSSSLMIKVLLAIINSKLISFYHYNTSANAFKGAFPKVLLQNLRELPLPILNVKTQEQLQLFVDQLLRLNVDFNESKLQTQIDQIKSKIDYYESRINEIVYQLYGLTEEEVRIVEGR